MKFLRSIGAQASELGVFILVIFVFKDLFGLKVFFKNIMLNRLG